MTLDQITSAIWNDIVSGLAGMNANETMSLDQLADEVSAEREAVLKEMYLKSLIKLRDLAVSINCIELDCKDQNKCPVCRNIDNTKMAKHFEIPRLAEGLGSDAIIYIGATDKSNSFNIYFDKEALKYNKYKRGGDKKPYVYIDKTPNENNMYDCWVFNAPFAKYISITAIFQDLRQLDKFNCCNSPEFKDFGSISTEVKRRIIEKKIRLYRQFLAQPTQTDLISR